MTKQRTQSNTSQILLNDAAGALNPLRQQLNRLNDEHRDLDEQIQAMNYSGPLDQFSMQKLKRQKLSLKDRIATIQDALGR